MANETPIGDIIAHAVGGGWGREDPAAGHSRVAIIRGTDFANIAMLNFAAIPRRYEADQKLPSRELRPDDIVLEISGGSRTSNQSTGRSLFVTAALLNTIGERTIPASFCRLIRVDPTRVFPRYAYYHLQEMYLAGRAAQYEHQSTGISNFQFTHFKESEQIRIPPQKEQQAIACILGALDDKIHLNREMNRTLEATARAIFKSWFVDFDPVRAKAAGHQPPGLKPDIAALFPNRFEDSELGEIPKGWSVTSLADQITAAKGLSYKGQHLCAEGEGLPMHNLNSVYEGGSYKHEGLKWYNGEYRPAHLLMPGDVIVTNTEQGFDYLLIGYSAIVPECYGPKGLFSHHIFRIRPKSTSYLPAWFTYLLLRTQRFHDLVAGHSNGTTVNMLPLDGLQKPKLVLPPEALVERFEALFCPAHQRIEQIHDENASLAALRDTLLPKLISGELAVAEAERIAGRCA